MANSDSDDKHGALKLLKGHPQEQEVDWQCQTVVLKGKLVVQ